MLCAGCAVCVAIVSDGAAVASDGADVVPDDTYGLVAAAIVPGAAVAAVPEEACLELDSRAMRSMPVSTRR